uniref:ORF2 n=1 Tax=Lactobacillus acidophilus TaxID=1579 RepID=Q48497_LACAI|nr:ORF2 [Lactobacillus acidophilus]
MLLGHLISSVLYHLTKLIILIRPLIGWLNFCENFRLKHIKRALLIAQLRLFIISI